MELVIQKGYKLNRLISHILVNTMHTVEPE